MKSHYYARVTNTKPPGETLILWPYPILPSHPSMLKYIVYPSYEMLHVLLMILVGHNISYW